MDVGFLDQVNRDGALTRIARCGGLVALGQLPAFLDCHKSSAHRTSQALERARMCAIVRPTQGVGFFILSKYVAAALGADLPVPPQRSKLRPGTVRDCVARAAWCLVHGQAPQSMGDLTGRWQTRRTEPRIQALVERQVAAWQRQAKRLYDEYARARSDAVRREYEQLRRKLREPGEITAVGMAALRYFRGLHFFETAELTARFVFVDRATTAARLTEVVGTLTRFGAATMIPARLDIACGSARARDRLKRLAGQLDLRLDVQVVDLDYERMLTGTAQALPPLVDDALKPVLKAIGAPGDG